MNLNGPNRWEDTPVSPASEGFLHKALSLAGRFMALPRGAQAAIVIIALIVLAGLTGTVLGWAFRLLAFLGRLILLALVVAFIVSLLRRRGKG